MKFLKLLNPLDIREGATLSVGDQQLAARKDFPHLVQASNLTYWKPGMPILQSGRRLLVGLAASFSLADLRLADILNDALNTPGADVCVDVFDVSNINTIRDLVEYYPEVIQGASPPIVGLWIDGVFEHIAIGKSAIQLVFDVLSIEGEPAAVIGNLHPPDRSLVED